MTIYDLRKQIGINVFTTDIIKNILQKEYKQPIIKINSMVKKKELLRLKRGVYAFAPDYREHSLNLIATANMIQRPSYVSFEYALSYHGLIPERVYTITSATTNNSVECVTEVGNFSYKKIPIKVYSLGLLWKYDSQDGGYMIASAEKSLCDTIQADKRIANISKKEILQYLEDDLRIDWSDLEKLDTNLIWKISMAYSSKKLQKLAASIKGRKKYG